MQESITGYVAVKNNPAPMFAGDNVFYTMSKTPAAALPAAHYHNNGTPMNKLYFIGIGGTAMGAVACALRAMGAEVTGSDANVYPPMSDFLRAQSIEYFEGYDEERLRRSAPDAVVVGNAVSRGNPELEYALEARIPMFSLPQLAGERLIDRNTSIVVSGTHGKTSTASLTAWLLETAGLAPGFLIGAIPGNFDRGCRPAPTDRHNSSTGYFVTEGDEYDSAFFDKRSKFVHYRPQIAIINNIEFDHADIFASLDDIVRSFRQFVRLIPRNGLLLAAHEDAVVRKVIDQRYTAMQTFGLEAGAYWRAAKVAYGAQGTEFTLLRSGVPAGAFRVAAPGEHNVKNALAAIAVCKRLSIADDVIQQGLDTFRLPKRRLEVVGEISGVTVVDDFAHHPTAIAATLRALRQRYSSRRLIACFEPRSNTTTRNIFQRELETCFDAAAIVALGALNRPDRYAPSDRLDIESLANALRERGKTIVTLDSDSGSAPDWGRSLARSVADLARTGDVIALLSNGDFGGLRTAMLEELQAGGSTEM